MYSLGFYKWPGRLPVHQSHAVTLSRTRLYLSVCTHVSVSDAHVTAEERPGGLGSHKVSGATK